MKLSLFPTLLCAFSAAVSALPMAMPIQDAEFELIADVKMMFEERFMPDEIDDFHSVIQKRDTELTIESLLILFNDSGILFDVLDLVAYSPSRIEALANLTARAIGNFNTSSISSFSSLGAALNFSKIYNAVMDSGVVTSLLDGILLDDSYRPTLVKLISRILEGNKNLFLYLVQDIFKKLKRDVHLDKRASSSLETFVGNIIALALSSQLVGGVSSDVLAALNSTQYLTYTVKELIANEGYQNMTAQFVIDIIKTGDLTINMQQINITKYADTLLSKPLVVVGLVSQLLSGNINLGGMGKYTDAVRDIVKDIEDDGVFSDLNNYVFSESHTVSKPLIQTNDIVVARTGGAAAATTTSSSSRLSSSLRSNRTTTSTSSPRTTSLSSEESESAAEVASILSVLGANTSGGSSSTRTTSRSSSRSGSSNSGSSLDINDLLSQLATESADSSETEAASLVVSSVTSAISEGGNILSLLAALDSTQNREVAASTSASSSSSLSGSMVLPNNFMTRVLVYIQAVLLGGVLLL